MPVILWGLLAVTAGFGVIAVAAWRAAPKAPPLPPGTDFPVTRLQKLAWTSLAVAGALAGSAAAIVVRFGPQTVDETDALRLTFTFLVLGTLFVLLAMLVIAKRWADRDDGTIDERDQAILDRAHVAQAPAILVTLAVWMVGLTESFRDPGGIPTLYMYLVFWSVLVIHVLALPVGVLLGYRRR